MKYYFNLDEFSNAVEERVETGKCIEPTLYRANPKLDCEYMKDDSYPLELLERHGKIEFATDEEAREAFAEEFSDAVADKIIGW